MEEIDLLIRDAQEIITFEGDGPLKSSDFSTRLVIKKGDIAIHNGKILSIGEKLSEKYTAKKLIEVKGMIVLPGFVDSHTHLPYTGSRHEELEEKTVGRSSYGDLHREGKGILYTVRRTREASFEELVEQGMRDLDIMMIHGTTTVEAKTGYGLNHNDELKLFRVIDALKKKHPMTIVPTFLGAHAVPDEFKNDRQGYIQLVNALMPEVKGLAIYCDVFCDPLGFSDTETREILQEGDRQGLKTRIHIDQTGNSHGGEIALEMGAVSVSHADYTSDDALRGIAEKGIYVELLPGVTYHLAEATPGGKTFKDFWPERTRHIIDLGIPVTLATNYNPGSSRMLSMLAVMHHGSRLYRMSFAEVIGAATINSAHSLGLGEDRGNILVGKSADLVVFDTPNYGQLIDVTGVNPVKYVIKEGKLVVHNNPRVYRDS